MSGKGSVRLERVVKRHGVTTVLHGVDLAIEPGEFFVLLGPSGSGKTTTLRILAGLEPVSEGRVLVDGEDVTTQEPGQRDVAMVFQSYALYPHMSVAQNIGFPLKMVGTDSQAIARAVKEAAAKVGIDHLLDRTPGQLSGGQQQRCALARAIVRQPRLFLLDEPLSNLDAKLRLETRLELHTLQRTLGATTVYVTHDQEEAMTLADRIAVFMEGRIVQVGTPREVFARPQTVDVAGFIGTPPMNLMPAVWDGAFAAVDGQQLPLASTTASPRQITLGVRPNDLRIADVGLPARVERIEDLGDSSIVSFIAGERLLKAKSDRLPLVQEGDAVHLGFAPGAAHLFDRQTGARLMKATKPNVVLILNDDMGFSDIGCYGGEIETPNLDRLAANGLRFSQFYNTARCSPSRASMLTGLHPHQTGVGILTYDSGPEGYAGNLNHRCVTIPQALKRNGYRTYMSGKWHVASSLTKPTDTWPLQRGFDEFYGTIIGAGSFYDPNTLTRGNDNVEHEAKSDPAFFYTDAISDQAVAYIEKHRREHPGTPFFEYVAYTAPHWPLHAHDEDIAKYKGRFDKGWDALREARLDKLVASGILHAHWRISDRDPTQPPWPEAEHKAWLLRCMEVYAAQVDRMDQGIGRIIAALEAAGELDNTIVIFLADNGACAEDIPENVTVDELVNKLMIAKSHTRAGEPVHFGNDPGRMPGPENTYQSYGTAWANLSNTPFRLYKHWIHEGGISTPLIVHWPQGIRDKGAIRHTPGYLPDIMATILDLTGTSYPDTLEGKPIDPLEGTSLAPVLESDGLVRPPMFWEHEGNAAVRIGKWKLVRNYPGPWELYDMDADRTELHDIAGAHPGKVDAMSRQYEAWAARCGVIPREAILALMKGQGVTRAFWEKPET